MVAFILSIIATILVGVGETPGTVGVIFISISSLLAIIAIYFGSKEFVTAKDDRRKWRALAGIIISVCVELESTLIYVTIHNGILSLLGK